MSKFSLIFVLFVIVYQCSYAQSSAFVTLNPNGSLSYTPDVKGNIIPDFSAVGYRRSNANLPVVPVVKTVTAAINGSSQQIIQDAINEVAQLPIGADGFRGAILFKKGIYNIEGTIKLNKSGIVLRGEGDTFTNGTKWVATGQGQRTLLDVTGSGSRSENITSRVIISDGFVPVGAFSFNIASTEGYHVGDNILLTRPGTEEWIHDLQMDAMVDVPPANQWKPSDYNLYYERVITKIEGNKVYIDNPVVMEMETKYGGGYISKYTFSGRIVDVGVEDIYFESEYTGDTDEDHGWVAVRFNAIENGWAKNITSRYFGYSCVGMSGSSKYITVKDSKCLDAKSLIEGSRRYSFNMAGGSQLNLVTGCYTSEGRHDYVTGGKTAGPNVFHNSVAVNTHSDIGPHQRWATGTLYDNITTDGTINVQDRGHGGGDWRNGNGNGHGWTGVTQVLWNCTANKIAVQSPWVSGKNYAIAVKGTKYAGNYFSNRPDGEWELQNSNVIPSSLYEAQLNARKLQESIYAKLSSFKVVQVSGGNKLSWKTLTEENADHFEVQRSANGNSFDAIITVPATGALDTETAYTFTDENPLIGNNYYRVRIVSILGYENLSPVIMIKPEAEEDYIFKQDFSHAAFVADYVDAANLGYHLFDALGIGNTTNGAGGGWSAVPIGKPTVAIIDNKLELSRSNAETGDRTYFVRTDLNPTTDFIKVSFKFEPTGIAANGSTQAAFQFGTGFSKDGTSESGAELWESIGISHFSTGKFAVRDGTNQTVNGTEYIQGAEYTITLYMNATDKSQTYTGPDNQTHTLAAKKWNAFVDNEIQFEGESNGGVNRSMSSNGAAKITDFKFYMSAAAATYRIDNLLVEAMPVTLPVSLTYFIGKKENGAIQLKWQTASEQNNSRFDVFHSTDGISFTKIGIRQGHGTSTQINNYAYTDKTTLLGTNYYQLVQVDNSGIEEKVGIVAVENGLDKVEKFKIAIVGEDILSITYFSDKAQMATLKITDILGRNIYNTSLMLQSGYNQQDLPFRNDRNKIYIISINTADRVQSLKFKK